MATGRHTSQIQPLSAEAGDEQLLSTAVQRHFERPWETFIDVGETWSTNVFERLHRADPDPWQTTSSDYEARKRDQLLSMLPEGAFGRAFEPGCSVGVLTQALAPRCRSLIAMDFSETAAAAARQRCAPWPQVQIRVGAVPGDWPDGELDLVVVSELGYFLNERELDGLIEGIRDRLAPGGVVALCHWRHPVHGWVLDGDTVHARVIDRLGLPVLRHHQEADFIADVLGSARTAT